MKPQLDLVGLVVADMAAALAFYRRLGLEFPAGADQQPHVEAALPGGLRLAFDTEESVRAFDPDWEPGQSHRIALAFRCPEPVAVDREYAELVGAGYGSGLVPFDAFWGQRYARVLDPDGNPIDLFAPLNQ